MKKFQVQLKSGHPTGTYRRGGFEFTSRVVSTIVPEPIILTESQLTEGLKSDPWLEVTEIEGGSPAPLAA